MAAAVELSDFLTDCEFQLELIVHDAEGGDMEDALKRAERLLRYIVLVEAALPFEESEVLCDTVMNVINING